MSLQGITMLAVLTFAPLIPTQRENLTKIRTATEKILLSLYINRSTNGIINTIVLDDQHIRERVYIKVNINDNITIYCHSIEKEEWEVSWHTAQGTRISADKKRDVFQVKGSKVSALELNYIKKNDIGTYVCKTTYENQEEQRQIYLSWAHASSTSYLRQNSSILFLIVISATLVIFLLLILSVFISIIRSRYKRGLLNPGLWFVKLAYLGTLPNLNRDVNVLIEMDVADGEDDDRNVEETTRENEVSIFPNPKKPLIPEHELDVEPF